MKNIIKRGTSLLLVVAMLLSFAVAVGAEPATTESGTGSKLVTLWADTVPLQTGEANYAYVPIYAKVSPQNGIAMLEFDLYCDSGLTILNIVDKYGSTSVEGKLESGDSDAGSGYKKVVWTNSVPLGWTTNPIKPNDPPTPPTTENVLVCWAIVQATGSDVGGKQIHFGPFNGLKENAPYRFIYKDGQNISSNPENHPYEDVALEDGAAIVYDESKLPMVALTKTTFDVPTMAEQEKDVLNAGKYLLSDYLKIVGKDSNGEVKVYPVKDIGLEWSVTENPGGVSKYSDKVAIDTQTGNAGTAKLTISAAKAASDSSIAIPAAQEVSFTVRKAETGLWKASFAAYNGRYMNANAFLTGSDFDTDEDGNKYVSAKAYDANSTTYKSVTIRPTAFDKYGQKLENVKANFEINLYSDAECKVSCTDSHVGKNNLQDELSISNQLERDVYCKVRTYVLDAQNNKVYGEEATFLIKSTKPYAKSAEVVLKDAQGEEIKQDSSGNVDTWYVPTDEKSLTIYISANIKDQNGNPMTGESYGIHYKDGESEKLGTGITCEPVTNETDKVKGAYKLEVTKEALTRKDFPITITLNATKADDASDLEGTRTITLMRAPSVATSIGSEINKVLTPGQLSYIGGHVTTLPGYKGSDDVAKRTILFDSVYVLDQYGDIMKNADGSNMVVSNPQYFKLYPADYNEETGVYTKKENAVPIAVESVKFEEYSYRPRLTLTNRKTESGLELEAGRYLVEAAYTVGENTMTAVFGLNLYKATTTNNGKMEYTADVEASTETISVPYADGTLGEGQKSEVTLTATVTDQYGEAVTNNVKMELNRSSTSPIKLGDSVLNLDEVNKPVKVEAVSGHENQRKVTLNSSAASKMIKIVNGERQPVNEAKLTIPVKVTVEAGAQTQDFTATATVGVSREASALKTATVTIKDATTNTTVKTETLTDTDNQKTINMISPKTETSYTIEFSGKDQYGDTLTDEFVSGTTAEESGKFGWWRPDQTSSYRMTVDATTKGLYQFTTKNFGYKVNVKFAPMQFVKGETGSEQITDGDMLHLDKIPTVYEGKTWNTILSDVKNTTQSVYIKNEGEGNNTLVEANSISYVVLPVGADGNEGATEIADTRKADAGSYKIKVIYTKDGQTYPVCEKSFTIEPKEVTIKINPPAGTTAEIKKEYDGQKTLPTSGLWLSPDGLVGIDDDHIDPVSVDPEMLEFVTADAGEEIAIRLKTAGTNCLKLDYGTNQETEATNYTVKLDGDGNVEGLTGTITKKEVAVYVEFFNKYWDGTTNVGEYTPTLHQGDIVSGETVGVNASLTGNELRFASSDVGAKLVTGQASSITATLTGANAGNYEVGEITYGGSAGGEPTIEKATFTINASGLNKTYTYGETVDLNVAANLLKKSTGQPIDTDTVSVIGNTSITLTLNKGPNSNGHYDVGTYTATVSVPTNQQNYTVNLNGTPTITIEKRGITIALKEGAQISKTYDGTKDLPSSITAESFDVTVAGGAVGNETVKLDVSELKYADANVSEKPIHINVGSVFWSIEGGEKLNYQVTSWTSLTGTITPKNITDNDNIVISQETFPVYNGKEQELGGSLLKVTDTEIGQNGGTVLRMGERNDYTVNSVKGMEANEDAAHETAYQLTVTGQGNYTGTKTFNAEIKKFRDTVVGSISSTSVTRGKTTVLYVTTAVALQESDLIKAESQVSDKLRWWATRVGELGIDVKVEPTGEKTLKVTVKVPNGTELLGKQFVLTLEAAFTASHRNIEHSDADNYTISVTNKETQTLTVATADGRSSYSYSEAGVRMNVSGNKTDVTWSIDPSNPRYQEYAEIVDGNYVKFKKPGIVTIKASAKETDDYAAAEQTYVLTITRGLVTVTASSATMTAGEALPGFSATASGLNPKDNVSDVFQTLTASVSTDGKTAGTYRVTPNATFKTGGTAPYWKEYYDLTFVQGTLTVNPATTVIDTILPTIIAGNGCANGYANCACEIFYDLDASRWYHEAIDWAYNLGLMNGTTKSTFGPNAAATRAQTWTMLARIAGQDTGRSVTWYEVGRTWAMGLGITDGTNPMGTLTREQLAAMLYRYAGSPAVSGSLSFSDSASVSTWAKDAMVWAVQNGILDGVGGNRLNPKGTTTRAQAAAIFMRFSKLINK